jgi:hypothetical protein
MRNSLPFTETVFTKAAVLSNMSRVHVVVCHLFYFHFDIVIPSIPRSSKWSVFFRFPTKTIRNFLIPCVPHVPSKSQSFIRWLIMLDERRNYEATHCAVLSSLLSPIALSLCAPSFATHETASSISDLLYMIVHLYETGTDRWHSVGCRNTLRAVWKYAVIAEY